MGSLPTEQRFSVNSICIIGAGPSGLAAAKYLLAERAFSRIIVFEQRNSVGGIWNYVPWTGNISPDVSIPQTNPHLGLDKPRWQHSSAEMLMSDQEKEIATFLTPMYDRLETNIPRGLMGFSDLDWPEGCQLFPEREKVLQYIKTYAEDLRHLICFRTQVLEVVHTADERWLVKTQDLVHGRTGKMDDHVFDAVVVASGHFNVPYIPAVRGIEAWSEAFPGAISHSKFYRAPEHYTGKKVIVVGNSASGLDIGAQIQAVCQWPLLVSQKSESFLLSDRSSGKLDKPPIAEFVAHDRSVRFEDGTVEADVDAVLYCTGYHYSIPFLTSLRPPLITTGERVENLHQHIFYRACPTLAFLVLNQGVIPFPLAEAQSAVIARVWSGRLALPSEHGMKGWEDAVITEMSDGKQFHVLKFPKDAEYINMLHHWAVSAEDKNSTFSTPVTGEVKIGKEPPYWGEREYWIRQRISMIKRAFQDLREDRHTKSTLDSVGFNFEQWKKNNLEERKTLL